MLDVEGSQEEGLQLKNVNLLFWASTHTCCGPAKTFPNDIISFSLVTNNKKLQVYKNIVNTGAVQPKQYKYKYKYKYDASGIWGHYKYWSSPIAAWPAFLLECKWTLHRYKQDVFQLNLKIFNSEEEKILSKPWHE